MFLLAHQMLNVLINVRKGERVGAPRLRCFMNPLVD